MRAPVEEWTLEPELDCSVPRKTVPKKRSVVVVPRAMFLVGIAVGVVVSLLNTAEPLVGLGLFGLIGLIALVWERDRRYSKALVERGVPTPGLVLAGEESGEDGWKSTVGFDTTNGEHVTIEPIWYSQVGQTATVLYLPESPKRARVYEQCDYRALGPRARS